MNMKSIKLTILPLAATLSCTSPNLLAQTETELDMTMTVIEEGGGPEGLVQRIRLPSPEEIVGKELLPDDTAAADTLVDQVESESAELLGEAAEVINDNVKNALSIEGAGELPGNIVDNLPEDLPLVDGIADDVDDELPLGGKPELPVDGELPLDDEPPIDDELPADDPLGTIDGMQGSVDEAANVADSIDESIDASVDEASSGVIEDSGVDDVTDGAADGALEQMDNISTP